MRLSDELRKASRIRLAPGQHVIVRTLDGARVEEGYISSVDASTGTVRVETDKAGADLQIDVDIERYDIWVQPPPEMRAKLGRQVSLYVRPSSPGVYSNVSFDG